MVDQLLPRQSEQSSGPPAPAIRMDLGSCPLVRVTFDTFGIDDVRRHLRQMQDVLEGGPAVFVYDVRYVRILKAAERDLYIELFRLRGPFLRERCLGVAMVIDSPLKRGVLSAIQWAVKIPFPIQVFGEESEARDWARQRLADAGE